MNHRLPDFWPNQHDRSVGLLTWSDQQIFLSGHSRKRDLGTQGGNRWVIVQVPCGEHVWVVLGGEDTLTLGALVPALVESVVLV